jgi:hypothetical protein
MLEILLEVLFSPAILFFVFGIITALVRADVTMPPALTTAMTIFLMMSIGLRGGMRGVESVLAAPDLIGVVVYAALLAMITGAFVAFASSVILRNVVKLKTADAWATGGHYGAVSAVTLAVAVGLASAAQEGAPQELIFVGWMPAMYPFMDAPALITAIVLGRMALARDGMGVMEGVTVGVKDLLRKGVFGMAAWLLMGSLVIGALAQLFSPYEMTRTMDFFYDMFRGVLTIFLLDMGMAAGRGLGELKALGRNFFKAVPFALIMPHVWGVLGILGVYAIHLAMPGLVGWGDALVFASMAGGASYISAPVAMRASIPEANPAVYLGFSVALTFPFNIMINVPMWMLYSRLLWGA